MMIAPELASRARARKTELELTFGGASTFIARYRAEHESLGTVLLIHGIRGTHEGLEAIVGALEHLDCLVPDLPAFGRSQPLSEGHDLLKMTDWLDAVITEFSPSIVIGHSYGTIIVANSKAAKNLTKLLINPITDRSSGWVSRLPGQLTNGFYKICASLGERAGRWLAGSRILVDGMTRTLVSTAGIPVRHWVYDQHRLNFNRFASLKSLLEHSKVSTSVSIRSENLAEGQTLLIAGELDPIVRAVDVLALQAPNCSVSIIEKVGHLIHYEAPEQVAQAVFSKLAKP